MPGMFANKTALVTGGANGIGQAIATGLAREGADVVVSDIDEAAGKAVAAEVAKAGRRSLFVKVDVASVPSIEAMVNTAVEALGHIDVFANNVGITRVQKLFDVTEKDWDLLHTVNARGAFFCMQAVARHMVERKQGRIVNGASIASLGYRETTSVAYSASKGAVWVMTQVAAHQLGPLGISVNAVCPGPTYTQFVLGGISPERRARVTQETMNTRMDERVPLGRANTPEDVANVVLFLLSDQARNVNGSAYVVDGGIMLR